MPTGIFWASSTNNPHSPIPNDGYAYMVYCLSNFFQIAYRITDAPSTIRALQRYCRDGVWQVWMDSFFTKSNLKFSAMSSYYIEYYVGNETNAINELNNPTLLFGGETLPYCIIFVDNAGTSPFGGGMTLVIGYIYANGEYGAQLAIKFGVNGIMIRNKSNGTWSEWNTIGGN